MLYDNLSQRNDRVTKLLIKQTFNSNKSLQHRQTKFGEKIKYIENEIPDVGDLANTSVFNTKIGEVEK